MKDIKLSEDELKSALIVKYGNITQTAKLVGVSAAYIYKLVDRYGIKDFLARARENAEDLAMATVLDNMDDVDVALKFLSLRQRANSAQISLGISGDVIVEVTGIEDKKDIDKFLS